MMSKSLLGALLIILIVCTFTHAKDVFVGLSGSDSNAGDASSSPFQTLSRALAEAVQHDIQIFFTEDGEYPAGEDVITLNSISFSKLRSDLNVILVPSLRGHLLNISANNVEFYGIHFKQNSVSSLLSTCASLTLSDCVFEPSQQPFIKTIAQNKVEIRNTKFSAISDALREQAFVEVLIQSQTGFSNFSAVELVGSTLNSTFDVDVPAIFKVRGGSLYITSSSFTGCHGKVGGCFHAEETHWVEVLDVQSEGCTGYYGSFFFSNSTRNLTVTTTTVARHDTVFGSIFLEGGSITADQLSVSNNVGISSVGLILRSVEFVRVQKSLFTDNILQGSAIAELKYEGGCVQITGSSSPLFAEVSTTTFQRNTAKSDYPNASYYRGHATCISAKGVSGISSNVLLDTVQFTENSGDSATACKLDQISNTRVVGSIFIKNTAWIMIPGADGNGADESAGGALWFTGVPGSVAEIIGSSFVQNEAAYGGGIFMEGVLLLSAANSFFSQNYAYYGGVFYSPAAISIDLHVEDSQFISNTGYNYGGVAMLVSSVSASFRRVLIKDCNTEYYGGAIIGLSKIYIEIEESEIVGNIARNGHGGAIYLQAMTADPADTSYLVTKNTVFSRNQAYRAGVVALGYFEYAPDNWKAYNCTFSSNVAAERGGVGFIHHDAEFYNCFFDSNSAAIEGGALYSYYHTLLVDRCEFHNHRADKGASIFVWDATLTVRDSLFSRSTASDSGGSIRIYTGRSTIDRSTFVGNSADVTGGALYISSIMTVDSCTFIENSSGEGGAIKSTNSAILTVLNSTFKANKATGIGGAVSADLQSGGRIANSHFYQNSANVGGALAVFSYPFTISEVDIIANHARTFGGGIYTNGFQEHSFWKVNIYDNTAERSGGGAYLDGGDIRTFSECVVANNTAGVGGGMSLSSRVNGTLVKTVVRQNNAATGAGLFLASLSTLHVLDSEVDSNVASSEGGGLFVTVSAKLYISNSVISHNSAHYNGGGFSCTSSTSVSLTGTSITENEVKDGMGGAIFVTGLSSLSIAGSSVTNNTANGGGGISVNELATVSLTGANSFVGNAATEAAYGGGAIHCTSGHLVASEAVSFVSNKAQGDGSFGGAIKAAKGCAVNTSLSTIVGTSNEAHFGGAIASSSDNLELGVLVMVNNVARGGGGAIYWDSKEPVFDKSQMESWTGNTAQYGSAIASSPVGIFTLSKHSSIEVRSMEELIVELEALDYYNQSVNAFNKPIQITVDIKMPDLHAPSGEVLSGNTATNIDSINSIAKLTFKVAASPKKSYKLVASGSDLGNYLIDMAVLPCRSSEELIYLNEEAAVQTCRRCAAGTYKTATMSNCTTCPVGGDCSLGGDQIYALQGYWKEGETANFIKCITPSCTGGANQCDEGYKDYLCKTCKSNYFVSGSTCFQCPPFAGTIVIAVLGCIFTVLFVGVILFTIGLRRHAAGLAIRKLLVKHIGLLALLYTQSDAPWLMAATIIGKIASWTSLDVFEIIFYNCFNEISFEVKYICRIVLPVAVVLVLILYWLGTIIIYQFRFLEVRKATSDLVRRLLLLLTLIFPSAATRLFSMYFCVSVENSYVLYAEPSINCASSSYNRVFGLNTFLMILFGVGFPAVCLLMIVFSMVKRLVLKRFPIIKKKYTRKPLFEIIDYVDTQLCAYFNANYTEPAHMFIMEALDIGRTIVYAYSFSYMSSHWQLLVAGLVTFASFLYGLIFTPFKYRSVNQLMYWSFAVLVLTCFAGIGQLVIHHLAIDIVVMVGNTIILTLMFVLMLVQKADFFKKSLLYNFLRVATCGLAFKQGKISKNEKAEEPKLLDSPTLHLNLLAPSSPSSANRN